MGPIFEFGRYLYEVVVVKLNILRTLELRANIYRAVSHTKIVGATTV
jgi:hypothetical protein